MDDGKTVDSEGRRALTSSLDWYIVTSASSSEEYRALRIRLGEETETEGPPDLVWRPAGTASHYILRTYLP